MTITVQCPSCSTRFPVDPAKVPDGGVHARCSVCAGVFFVAKPPQIEDAGAEPTPGDVAAPDAEIVRGSAPEADAPAVGEPAPDEPWEAPAEKRGAPTEEGEEVATEGAEPTEERAESAGEGYATPPPLPDEGHVPDGVAAPATPPAAFQFGRRDPHEKAQRLARVLVSDMIMYHPERHARALEEGSLARDFEDEIRKSWEEYVDQVGDELARSTGYFNQALNDILARGDQVFQGSPPLD